MNDDVRNDTKGSAEPGERGGSFSLVVPYGDNAEGRLGKFRSATGSEQFRIVYVDRNGRNPRLDDQMTRGRQALTHHYARKVDIAIHYHSFQVLLPSRENAAGFPFQLTIGYRVVEPAELLRSPVSDPVRLCESHVVGEIGAITCLLGAEQANKARERIEVIRRRELPAGHGLVTWIERFSVNLDTNVDESIRKYEDRDRLTAATIVDDNLETLRHSGALGRRKKETAAEYDHTILVNAEVDDRDEIAARERYRKAVEGDSTADRGRQLLGAMNRPELDDPDAPEHREPAERKRSPGVDEASASTRRGREGGA
ncbi:hypothetical protein [Frankia sp. CiP3]|uniref:hypothetical protein n=1 Tax=Frankia sp. CiP3 TaxID=2880971 RepID=UPI001EF659E6|nr:hypothetical protein [Frankia sp. CiP3]